MLLYKDFIDRAARILRMDANVLGLAIGGSWITKEMDQFSDLDLIVVTKNKIYGKAMMASYASRLGNLLNAFTGDHVGEPRLLICLFDDPLLHVDIKFLTPIELESRIENPEIIFDTDDKLKDVISSSVPYYPIPDYQWIEDRFWTWVHYIAGKISRGELYEALDTLSFLRANVFGPLLHIKNNGLPRGVRKLETVMNKDDASLLEKTIATYNKPSLCDALQHSIELYKILRNELFVGINFHTITEKKVIHQLTSLC